MKKFLIITAKGSILILVLCCLLFIGAGWIVNSSISYFLRQNEIEDLTLRVEKLTPWTAILHGSLGPRDNPAVSVPMVKITYSPKTLAQGRVDSVSIDGATVAAAMDNGKIGLENFKSAGRKTVSTSSSMVPVLPLAVNSLQFNNCRLSLSGLNHTRQNLTISSKATFNYSKTQDNFYKIENITADAETSGTFQASLHTTLQFGDNAELGTRMQLQDLSDFMPFLREKLFSIYGRGELQADLILSRDLQSLNRLKGYLELSDAVVDTGAVKLVSAGSSPLMFAAEGNTTEIDYRLTNVNIRGGVSAKTSLAGKLFPAAKKFNGAGQLVSDALQVPVNIELQGALEKDHKQLSAQISGENQKISSGSGEVAAGPYTLQTRIFHSPGELKVEKQLSISSVRAAHPDIILDGVAADFAYSTRADSISPPGSGNIEVEKIQFRGEDLAGLRGKLTSGPEFDIDFDGALNSHLANPFVIRILGNRFPNGILALKLFMPQTPVDSTSLPSFITLPENMAFAGNVKADGTLTISGGASGGSLALQISDGDLTMEENNLSISGISTNILLPDLPRLQSSPSQLLEIEDIQFGTVHLSNGRITYRLETDNSLFIEKSRFNWCSGRVEGGSLRIKRDDPEFTTSFYCDRLQFSELLNQFGITGTEGDASLNGRLPVSLSQTGITFDDGFLFSTPGNSGIVHFTNSDMLRDSMPDMGRAAYLDYSLQALDNFSYNWTKLTFNSEGDDLLVSMQIDGKPAEPLPFGYKKGQLVPSTKGGGIQHPIRLDVNFHLPLAEMFKYGQNIQSIMENM